MGNLYTIYLLFGFFITIMTGAQGALENKCCLSDQPWEIVKSIYEYLCDQSDDFNDIASFFSINRRFYGLKEDCISNEKTLQCYSRWYKKTYPMAPGLSYEQAALRLDAVQWWRKNVCTNYLLYCTRLHEVIQSNATNIMRQCEQDFPQHFDLIIKQAQEKTHIGSLMCNTILLPLIHNNYDRMLVWFLEKNEGLAENMSILQRQKKQLLNVRNAFHVAAYKDNLRLAELLYKTEAGKNLMIQKTGSGELPCDIASRRNCTQMIAFFQRIKEKSPLIIDLPRIKEKSTLIIDLPSECITMIGKQLLNGSDTKDIRLKNIRSFLFTCKLFFQCSNDLINDDCFFPLYAMWHNMRYPPKQHLDAMKASDTHVVALKLDASEWWNKKMLSAPYFSPSALTRAHVKEFFKYDACSIIKLYENVRPRCIKTIVDTLSDQEINTYFTQMIDNYAHKSLAWILAYNKALIAKISAKKRRRGTIGTTNILHVAAYTNDEQLAREVHNYGLSGRAHKNFYNIYMQQSDAWGNFPIHTAVLRGNKKILAFFIDHGASLDQKNERTPPKSARELVKECCQSQQWIIDYVQALSQENIA